MRITTPDPTRATASTIVNAAASSKTANVIPAKYLATPQSSNHEAVDAAFRTSWIANQQASSKTVDTAENPQLESPTIQAFKHASSRPTNGPRPPLLATPLAEPPHWILHVLTAWLTFGIIVAIVLYLAQFPPKLEWWQKFRIWRRGGYVGVEQEDQDDGSELGTSSAAATFEHEGVQQGSSTSHGLRNRKPRGLTISVNNEYHGLGIAVPGDKNADRTPRKRRSYDEEALRLRPESPVKLAWESFTAPLPSIDAFVNDHHRKSEYYEKTPYPPPSTSCADSDMESAVQPPHSWTGTPDVFNVKSPYPIHFGGQGFGGRVETPGSALFRRINGGIHHAAEKLSRSFHDQVTGPEEGLFLPIRECEREQDRVQGVFVD